VRLIKNLEFRMTNGKATPPPTPPQRRGEEGSSYYVDTLGQLRFKPIKLGSKHPMYYLYRTDKIVFDALTRTFDRAEMNIIKFFEKIFG
jgi:hypothetical protein